MAQGIFYFHTKSLPELGAEEKREKINLFFRDAIFIDKKIYFNFVPNYELTSRLNNSFEHIHILVKTTIFALIRFIVKSNM